MGGQYKKAAQERQTNPLHPVAVSRGQNNGFLCNALLKNPVLAGYRRVFGSFLLHLVACLSEAPLALLKIEDRLI
jgi:hypothetical protein